MLAIECPKRSADKSQKSSKTYSYYAGYSLSFAERLIQHAPLDENAIVFDPWNGSGTTTLAASLHNIESKGSDLNPVMVVVAKARMLRAATSLSINPIWTKIKAVARKNSGLKSQCTDPLTDWFSDNGVTSLRVIENAIKSHLVPDSSTLLLSPALISNFSDIAAFFYVSLFRVTGTFLKPFKTSNPTWLRRPKEGTEKLDLNLEKLIKLLDEDIRCEIEARKEDWIKTVFTTANSELMVGSSEAVALEDNSVDLVLTSPPYCTRLDYAVATAAELAILGFHRKIGFAALRESLMGTTTVPCFAPDMQSSWGKTCTQLLRKIAEHNSVASKSYYLKNHLAYFSSLQKSISEISRVLKSDGIASFVVQDSVYKDIHNDLPLIVLEMSEAVGLTNFQRDDFRSGISISNINTKSRFYQLSGFRPTESVVSFYKT